MKVFSLSITFKRAYYFSTKVLQEYEYSCAARTWVIIKFQHILSKYDYKKGTAVVLLLTVIRWHSTSRWQLELSLGS